MVVRGHGMRVEGLGKTAKGFGVTCGCFLKLKWQLVGTGGLKPALATTYSWAMFQSRRRAE